MDKNAIKVRLDRIVAASESIISVGAQVSLQNGQQLAGIQRMAGEIWQLINAAEEKEAESDGR